MKLKKVLFVVNLMFLLFAFCGMISVNADINYQTNYTESNVALGKNAKYTYADGTEIPAKYVLDLHTSGAGVFNCVTDGDIGPGGGHSIINLYNTDTNQPIDGFAVVDLGQSYTITSFGLSFWHIHEFTQVVLQVSNSEDFSDALTIYNSDSGNVMNQGVGNDSLLLNYDDKVIDIKTSPVYGRYVRVSGRSTLSGLAMFTEIEVNAITEGVAPVYANLVRESQLPTETLKLSSQYEDANIYYTTDGTYPTINSTKYTGELPLSSFDTTKILVRAIVELKDGSTSKASTFKFNTLQETRNLALGKIPTFSDDTNLGSITGTNTIESVTDGREDPFNAYGTTTDNPVWLYLDLGEVSRIDKVKVKLYHNWAFGAIIQLSKTADFSEGNYTVFSNYGKGSGIWDGVDNVEMTNDEWYAGMKEFNFYPVDARYLRIYSVSVQSAARRSAWEEIQVYSAVLPDEAYDKVGKNVALGKTVTFSDDSQLFDINNPTTIDTITDGKLDVWYAKGSRVPVWLYLDLGETVDVDTVKIKLWHEWWYGAVVQLSTTSDFSEGNYTVFSNYGISNADTWDLIDEVPATSSEWWKSQANTLTEFNFEKVKARYLRLFCFSVMDANRYSIWEEVQVFSASQTGHYVEPTYPVVQRAITSVKDVENINVPYSTTKENVLAKLDQTLSVVDEDGVNAQIEGSWDSTTYAATTSGDYEFKFTSSDVEFKDSYDIIKLTVTVAPQANKEALDAKIKKYEQLDSNLYVSDKWALTVEPYQQAALINQKSDVYQSEVDEALNNLTEAMNQLVLRGNKDNLNELINSVSSLVQSQYSAESWNNLTEELGKANTVKNNDDATQTQVDGAYDALLGAKNGLKKLGDKTNLQTRYDALKDTTNIYTSASWYVFTLKLENANTVLQKTEAFQDEIDAALQQLNDSFTGLVVKADFSALNQKVEEANAKDLTKYTTSTGNALSDEIAAATILLNNDETTQAVLDEEVTTLTNVMSNLVLRGDKTELNALLNGNTYNASDYTATSYNNYLAAKQSAQIVVDNVDATQEDVDGAKQNLQTNISNLERIGDKTELSAAIASAKELDEGKYTSESYSELSTAITYAESICGSNDVNQQTCDDALQMVNTAVSNLVEKTSSGLIIGIVAGSLAVIAGVGALVVTFVLKRKKL